ncbi:response regulator [bacterium]|nr:response regulator [bacterium]
MENAVKLKELIEFSQHLSVLYVEDDEQLRKDTLRLLSTFFKHIEPAVNGKEGLEKYQSGDYEIVISDLRMPVMDGIEMVRRIREVNDNQIILITSAHDESQYLLQLISMGVNNFILKPLDIKKFLSVLEKTIELVRLRKMESDYKKQLEETVRLRTKELSELNEELAQYNETLEQKVTERTEELNRSLLEVERANKKLMDSIEYAKVIQRSLLPNVHQVKKQLPGSFFIWMPRDVVGGDIFFLEFFDDNFLIGVMDCTGHGVPGAFMTMIASTGLRRITKDEGCLDPAEILKRLNFIVKTSLQQDTEFGLSDDGLDAAICFVNAKERILSFSGARLPLVTVHNGDTTIIKGDRESIGYKKSNLDYRFTKKIVDIKEGMSFYLYSDGVVDQIGGEKNFGFGHRRFHKVIRGNHQMSFDQQQKKVLQEFEYYKGDNEIRDDVTIIGFSLDS